MSDVSHNEVAGDWNASKRIRRALTVYMPVLNVSQCKLGPYNLDDASSLTNKPAECQELNTVKAGFLLRSWCAVDNAGWQPFLHTVAEGPSPPILWFCYHLDLREVCFQLKEVAIKGGKVISAL